jgi:glutamyl-tRNA synthetase
MTVITRFAPSPTGLLHVGNVRTALVNYLFTKNKGGKFMLRMDDTDLVRSKIEYADAIQEDLKWLGLNWDIFARQSDRLDRYEEIKNQLIAMGRLYPCYEKPEELEFKRKIQLGRGVPPIYDRAALKITPEKKAEYKTEGRKPHYRFLLKDEKIEWNDEVRGNLSFEGKNLSDPILVREDGTMTYILSSVIDDIDFMITNIIRGEDHISNTAIQVQIFAALSAKPPVFAHTALISTKDAKISKREGGFDIRHLREDGFEPMAICSLFSKLGTSDSVEARTNLDELAKEFDIKKFSRSPANYDQEDLLRINHKLLNIISFDEVKVKLEELGLKDVTKDFWEAARPNINKLPEIKEWWDMCYSPLTPVIEDSTFLSAAAEVLPTGNWDNTTWQSWTKAVQEKTGKKGKDLFMPLRKAITGMEHGPELKILLPLIGREKVLARLAGKFA